MMVPGYGEELEMGFNATSPSAIANSARTNITESLQQGTLMWSTSLRPIYANGPQLICTHCVEKEFCWKGECYVGTLRKSSGLFLSWAAAMPSSGALVSDNDTWLCPHAPKHLIKYLFFFVFFVFDFISCLLQTVTHDQAPEPHNILSHAQPFFWGIFMFYTLSHSLQTGTHDQAPTAQNSFSSKKQKFCAFMFCYICCRQWHIGVCQQAP